MHMSCLIIVGLSQSFEFLKCHVHAVSVCRWALLTIESSCGHSWNVAVHTRLEALRTYEAFGSMSGLCSNQDKKTLWTIWMGRNQIPLLRNMISAATGEIQLSSAHNTQYNHVRLVTGMMSMWVCHCECGANPTLIDVDRWTFPTAPKCQCIAGLHCVFWPAEKGTVPSLTGSIF